MDLKRVEEIEKRMDELDLEMESLSSNPDKEFVNKRSAELVEESQKLSAEMFDIVSKVSESLGIDLNDIDSDENTNTEAKEEE